MVYYNFRIFICICFLLGIGKLLNISSGRVTITKWFNKIWPLVVIVIMVLCYYLSKIIEIQFNVKNLAQFSNLNDFVVNIAIIVLNMFCGVEEYQEFNDIFKNMFSQFKMAEISQKILCLKVYMYLIVPLLVFIVVITLEFIYDAAPFVLLLKLPTFVTILYVSLHLCLILMILKIINQALSYMLLFNNNNIIKSEWTRKKTNIICSVLSSDYEFSFTNKKVNLKSLTKIYDDASTCIFYLEKIHGLQIVLAIWLTFSTAVVGVTVITWQQSNLPWLVIVKSILPFSWCFLACYIEDQLTKEVKQTETLIVKYLIDYRCGQATRNILQTFKQLVSTNRLTFTAGNVFHLDYGLILGTIINVITYSIILIQLFQSG